MVDGIYTAYLTGRLGQAMAMFVFRDGQIGGADMVGLTFAGHYKLDNGRVVGSIVYKMPANSVSITGAEFENQSQNIEVSLDLPEEINPEETYRISTPIGPMNAKFVKNIGFE